MKRFFLLVFASLVLQACSKGNEPRQEARRIASATLLSLENSGEKPVKIGEAHFFRLKGAIGLEVEVEGLPPGGSHALHVHEGSCVSPGAHWNGGTEDRYCDVMNMGQAWGKPFLGDIGNIHIGADGKGRLELQTTLWAVGDGSQLDVAGKALMLHAHPEDYEMGCDSQHQHHPQENAKIACGEIELINAQ